MLNKRERLYKHFQKYQHLYLMGVLVPLVLLSIVGLIAIQSKSTGSLPANPNADMEWNVRMSATVPADAIPGVIETASLPLAPNIPQGIPVTVVTATKFLNLLESAKPNRFTNPVINPATSTVVATSVVESNQTTLVAHLLPKQVSMVNTMFVKYGVPPTVVTVGGTPGMSVGRNNATSTVSGGGGNGVTWLYVLGILLPIMLVGGVLVALSVRRRTRKAREVALVEKAEADTANIPDVTFADVAGAEEAVEELAEIVSFLKDPEHFSDVGASSPKGAILVGPPGTGKTLLARAVAGEAGVPFYTTSGSDFVEMYVGVGPKRIRELFAKARVHDEGAIIFIDEIDAVGRKRENGPNHHQEQEATLNALLVEMDGFYESKVIVLAATNRDDILDPALLRPGRLDRKVQVPLPDRGGREHILEVHSQNKPLGLDVDLTLIARRTPGMSGAELAQLVNEACLQAAREKTSVVTAHHFDHAVATIAMGKARTSAIVTDNDRTVTAWHEAGHTVAAMILPDADDPVSVSIIPRGPAGGITWMASGDDLFLTRKRAHARIVVAMAGRAAEEMLLHGEFTSGPHGDLQAATNTALAMITQYGMTDVGLMIRSDGLLSTGSSVTDATVNKVEQLLADALAMARDVLNSHRSLVETVVFEVLEKDTLVASDLDAIRIRFEQDPPLMPPAPKEYRKTVHLPELVPTTPRLVRRGVIGLEEDRVPETGLVGTLYSVVRTHFRKTRKPDRAT